LIDQAGEHSADSTAATATRARVLNIFDLLPVAGSLLVELDAAVGRRSHGLPARW
jgi:hypothetical protein